MGANVLECRARSCYCLSLNKRFVVVVVVANQVDADQSDADYLFVKCERVDADQTDADHVDADQKCLV